MVPNYTLRQGAKGQETADVQAALVQRGFKVAIDGDFGPATTQAVKDAQKAAGLTVDGVVGPATLAALCLPVPAFWVDVSHYQGAIDWGKVAASGVKGAVVKATNGEATDSKLIANVDGASGAGLPVMVYAYAKPDPSMGDARQEAHYLWQRSQNLPMVLDLEERNGMSGSALATWAADWISQAFLDSGRWPTVYSNSDFIQTVFARGSQSEREKFAKCDLWLAQLTGDNDPSLPRNPIWQKAKMLQYRWDGEVPGIPGKVDCNWRWP